MPFPYPLKLHLLENFESNLQKKINLTSLLCFLGLSVGSNENSTLNTIVLTSFSWRNQILYTILTSFSVALQWNENCLKNDFAFKKHWINFFSFSSHLGRNVHDNRWFVDKSKRKKEKNFVGLFFRNYLKFYRSFLISNYRKTFLIEKLFEFLF
jgi:hypothetical protein